MKIEELKQKIDYKWKVQSYNSDKTKGSCVAYIDARDVMDILDRVCGPTNWQDKYEFVGDKLIAGIGIYDEVLKEWIWKFDTGTESDKEGEKGIFSDAFKRAAVKWGVGRFLYDLEIKWIKIENKRPVDENGNVIWDLTKYFNEGTHLPTKVQEKPVADSKGLQVTCEVCKSLMVHKTGTTKAGGIEWSGWFCPTNKDHPPRWV